MELSLDDTLRLLSQADNVIITGHIHPDGDCLGSMLALSEYLRSTGIKVRLLLDGEISSLYKFLPGIEDITTPGEDILDSDLLVVVDASDVERIARVKAVVNAKILNIDHHISNTKFADFWHIDIEAAATGIIIMDLLRKANAVFSSTIAVNLYTAIATDCGFFRYANTTASTLRHAADLIEAGARPNIITENLETKPFQSLITLKHVLETLEIHYKGQIASIIVSQEINDSGAENTEGLINYPRNIEGVEIAIMFKVVDESTTRVSLRSRNVDVSQLALSFGGGGHARAAGCTVTGGFPDAKEKILAASIRLLLAVKS